MTREQEPSFISPEEHQTTSEGNSSGQINTPRLAEQLRSSLIIARGAALSGW